MVIKNNIDELCINTIRTLSIDAVQAANSGHPGTPMAMAPVVYTIWQRFLRFDPDDPIWPNRDRFVLSSKRIHQDLHSSLLIAILLMVLRINRTQVLHTVLPWEIRLVKQNYGWPEDSTFLVPDTVREHFKAVMGKRGHDLRETWMEKFNQYKEKYPELADNLYRMQHRELPNEDIELLDKSIKNQSVIKKPETCIKTINGDSICYTVCNRFEGRFIAALGGFFVGMISTGLGELNGYFLLQRCRVPSKVAVATSVFVVAITALTAASGHLLHLVNSSGETPNSIITNIVIFTVPGVIIGTQFGPIISNRISQNILERTLGVLFIIVAIVTLLEVIS